MKTNQDKVIEQLEKAINEEKDEEMKKLLIATLASYMVFNSK
jgi:hypothetical protein